MCKDAKKLDGCLTRIAYYQPLNFLQDASNSISKIHRKLKEREQTQRIGGH
jgi:hypothetical protein